MTDRSSNWLVLSYKDTRHKDAPDRESKIKTEVRVRVRVRVRDTNQCGHWCNLLNGGHKT